ncbi:hypothetical protein HanRHA438_Chr02g0059911 [Helianthus annuus]|nr:hypothetical protein HanRHA438_Chr02g0059911 [Helianthus annuus]
MGSAMNSVEELVGRPNQILGLTEGDGETRNKEGSIANLIIDS